MADFNEVFEQNKDKFGEDFSPDSYTKLSTKLNELGYDVLLNHKEKAEFVPTSRLGEVVSQRDNFKTQVQDLNKQLQTLKDGAKGNEELQGRLQSIMDDNQKLLSELEQTKINSELMIAAKDALNPKDVLAFVDRANLKLNAKGDTLGIEAEIARIRAEKPYLFRVPDTGARRGGSDSSGGDGSTKLNMNSLIRMASGRN